MTKWFATACVFGSLCLAQTKPVPSLGKSFAFDADFVRQPIPHFKDGYILAYDHDRTKVTAWDASGKVVSRFRLTLPDATRVSVTDVAAAPDGTLAISASGIDGQGRLTNVIAWVTSSGRPIRLVETRPFAARRLAFMNDGSLWALGRVYDASFNDQADYGILRHYDAQGVLLLSAVPRSSFNQTKIGTKNPPTLDSFLVTSDDRIGIVSITADEFVEVSPQGSVLGRWSLPPLDGMVGGAAMTARGSVLYMGIQSHGAPNRAIQNLYRFDKATAKLIGVDTSGVRTPEQGIQLMGSDRDDLVVKVTPPQSVRWLHVQ